MPSPELDRAPSAWLRRTCREAQVEDGVERLAERVAVALVGADPGQFAELLDPHVTWGAPGDPSPACQNRQQVLAWYQRGRADGRRAQDVSVTRHGDKLLVSMTVTSADATASGQSSPRWQVLTVVDGRIADIRGYDNELDAIDAVRQPG
jgi:SnoaL-like domain